MNNIEISIYKQNYSINSVLAPGVIFFSLLLITFCFLAVFSLMNQVAIVPIIWLVIATLVFIWFLWEYKYVSIKYFLIDTFSFYAKREFVVIELKESKSSIIRFGYDFFGFQTFGFSIPIDKIKEVSWQSYQASSIAQEDMNDWRVSIGFNNDPPIITKDYDFHLMPTASNGYLTKDEAQKLGLNFVDFLNKVGVDLIKSKPENKQNNSRVSYKKK